MSGARPQWPAGCRLPRTLSGPDYPPVTLVFRGCYGYPGTRQDAQRTLLGVVERKDIATWLAGPARRQTEPGSYAGQRLGLPEQGRGAVAGFGRRVIAYLIDSAAC